MIARILMRLATVWAIGIGALILAVGTVNETLGQGNWPAIVALVLGPPAVAFALAWVLTPRR